MKKKSNKKILLKTLFTFLTLTGLIALMRLNSYAIETNVITDPYKGFGPSTDGNTKFLEAVQLVLAYIQYFSVAILLATIFIAGIMVITSSSEGKADVKGAAIGFLIGSFLVFLPVTLIRTIIGLIQ